MQRVSDLLEHKGRDVWSLVPEATVFEALEEMAQKRVGALLVMEGERLVGIFSERDYARKVILLGKSSRKTPVREIMSHRVVYADPDLTIEIMDLLADASMRGTCVLVATHDLELVRRYGKRAIRLEEGRIAEDTPATGRAA